MSAHIGLKGTGNDVELDIVRETERAYLLLHDDGTQVWMPKSAFDEEGNLKDWAVPMLEEKLEGAEGA